MRASIRIDESRYINSRLIIVGENVATRTVTPIKKCDVKSDGGGRFKSTVKN